MYYIYMHTDLFKLYKIDIEYNFVGQLITDNWISVLYLY